MTALREANNRSGIAMFSAIFVLLIIGLLAMQLHFYSRHTRLSAFRFQTSEVARQLAAAAIEEALAYVLAESEKPDGTFFRYLVERPAAIDCSNIDLSEKNQRGIEVPVELTIKQAKSMEIGSRFSISATARIVDFRNTDMAGTSYYGKEGVGTIELRVMVEPEEEYRHSVSSACTMTRHHDYKVVTIVARRDNSTQRSEYAGSYVLDYALFLRNGQEEFTNSAGASLNPAKQRLVISQSDTDPTTFGKVFFGNKPGQHVYLNIDKKRMHFIPQPQQKEFSYDPADQQIFRLLPDFFAAIKKLARQVLHDIELSYGNFVMTNFSADFLFEKLPLCDDDLAETEASASIIKIRNALRLGRWPANSDQSLPAVGAGIVIEPEESLRQILEGNVRQRFMQIASLFIELNDARIFAGPSEDTDLDSRRIDDNQLLRDFSTRKYTCFDPERFNGRQPDGLDIDYLKSQIYRDTRDPDLFSKIDSNNAYLLQPSPLPQPVFYLRRWAGVIEDPSLAAVPFAHINLWSRQNLSRRQLESFGIYLPRQKKLKLRGIIQCKEPVVLGGNGDGDIEVEGCGILIAPGIRIETGIKKAPGKEVVCVLATRGQPITVNTDHRIEASLISMGILDRNGHIQANRRLDLYGSLAVDRLAIDRWSVGEEHRITYDPALKRQNDLYQVNIARWITFERVVEKDE
ncbi:MAG: hypothetical protein KKB51_16400 [Candidatus Riflebacteria bacterium]|nr:hypothetical protein [Candidatus Riflebacteria bacterium]